MVQGCKIHKTPDELKEYFYNHQTSFDQLVLKIESDKLLDSLFDILPGSPLPNIREMYPSEYKLLKDCGIKSASSCFNSYPKGTKWFYFETNWPGYYPIYLSCNKYDSTQRQKGFYKTDQYSNEWWGLGDGWQMLQLVKEIDYVKQ